MTEDENNLLLGLLGTGVAIVLAWFGMNANKPAQASQGSFGAPAPPKAKTGCGCGK